MTKASYFISRHRAYRSEIALFRSERLTAGDCMVVQARPGAQTLYIVEGRRGAVTVTADIGRAWDTFQTMRAVGLQSVTVTA